VRSRNAGEDGPLDGVRVLDLGAIIAGPFAASLLGDLGADVIKVEPVTGDSFRGPGFAAYNKGQRGVALDLRKPQGKAAFLDLVRTADVVIDNYRPGVLARLGIEWDELTKTNAAVISASITGFGDGGPFGGDAGFDPVLQAMSGMMRAQGGDSDPVFFTVPVNDVAASATLALGCILALYHRERTGVAQRVTTSLAAMSVLLQAEALVRYRGRPPAPRGSRDHPGPSDHQRFHRTTDGWIRVEAPSADALVPLGVDAAGLADWASKLSRTDALRHLHDAGIPAVAVRTLAELAADPDVQRHEVLHRDPRPDRQGFTSGRHALFSRTMRTDTLVSPRLGEHTREVLAEIGYTGAQIDELVECGAATETRPLPATTR
jgi:crotonobetainyl-CoA:carnitine CoA-transferase CaiB-like acyl-CoA transferase